MSPYVVMRIGVALTGAARVRTAMSLSIVVGLYDGWVHCRRTAVAWPPCRSVLPSASVVGSTVALVTTAPYSAQL